MGITNTRWEIHGICKTEFCETPRRTDKINVKITENMKKQSRCGLFHTHEITYFLNMAKNETLVVQGHAGETI
jgi:hypothetical protein